MRRNLILCEEDDEKLAEVMRRIYDRAEQLRQTADDEHIWRLSAARELEWAASLLSGTASPSAVT